MVDTKILRVRNLHYGRKAAGSRSFYSLSALFTRDGRSDHLSDVYKAPSCNRGFFLWSLDTFHFSDFQVSHILQA